MNILSWLAFAFSRNSFYRTVTECAEDAIFLFDRSEKLIFVNRFGAAMLAAQPDALIGKQLKELLPKNYDATHRLNLQVMESKKAVYGQEEIDFPDMKRFIEIRLVPILNKRGDILRIAGIARDITEARKTDITARLNIKALEAAHNAIVIADRDGIIQWVNEAFTRMTGYSFKEAIGQPTRILRSGAHPKEVYQDLWATVLSGCPWSGELINRRKDGTTYPEKQTITPVKNEAGIVTHFIAIKQDISRDRQLEAQLQQAQKMEAVGRLAGGVAHDFNNLLTVVLGQCDLLLSEPDKYGSVHEAINEIRASGVRAAALTRQLLAFSRKQVFQMKTMNLNEVVRNSDKLMRRLVGEDIELVTFLGEKMRNVKVDPSQIEQVILNLAVNARDAMPKGGKLMIETSVVSVSATDDSRPGLTQGKYVLLKVADTGCGIPLEAQKHIFEPFFTTKEIGKGTGLGLATVYGIVKQSDGFIYCESRPGEGAAFLIYLPVVYESHAEEGALDEAPLPKGHETILVVEDESMVLGLAGRILRAQGYRVLEARNGLEALETAAGHKGPPIGLVFTDIVMPQMGGLDLVKRLREKHPGLKIIFTSGYTDHVDLSAWTAQGCRFLQKPYTQTELLKAIREVLDSVTPVTAAGRLPR